MSRDMTISECKAELERCKAIAKEARDMVHRLTAIHRFRQSDSKIHSPPSDSEGDPQGGGRRRRSSKRRTRRRRRKTRTHKRKHKKRRRTHRRRHKRRK